MLTRAGARARAGALAHAPQPAICRACTIGASTRARACLYVRDFVQVVIPLERAAASTCKARSGRQQGAGSLACLWSHHGAGSLACLVASRRWLSGMPLPLALWLPGMPLVASRRWLSGMPLPLALWLPGMPGRITALALGHASASGFLALWLSGMPGRLTGLLHLLTLLHSASASQQAARP